MSVLEDLLDQQLQITGITGYLREYAFAKPRKFHWDFCWPDRMIAVEVHGGIWTGGRHVSGTGFTRDCEKRIEGAIR
ncbi:MAG: hypothetical protein Q7O66_14965, partial [Dehalococcoidia bacterium]|nr:hypothetical protein [Dehalococcoidia bacterium]